MLYTIIIHLKTIDQQATKKSKHDILSVMLQNIFDFLYFVLDLTCNLLTPNL